MCCSGGGRGGRPVLLGDTGLVSVSQPGAEVWAAGGGWASSPPAALVLGEASRTGCGVGAHPLPMALPGRNLYPSIR